MRRLAGTPQHSAAEFPAGGEQRADRRAGRPPCTNSIAEQTAVITAMGISSPWSKIASNQSPMGRGLYWLGIPHQGHHQRFYRKREVPLSGVGCAYTH